MSCCAKLALRVKWTWGESKIVECYAGDVVQECLHREGFKPIEETKLLVAYKGKLVNIQMSFIYNKIETGSVIVVGLKRTPLKSKSQLFLESLEQRTRSMPVTPIPISRVTDSSSEFARIGDLQFAAIECSRHLPAYMSEMLQEQQYCEAIYDREPTVVQQTTEIRSDPLPTPFPPKERTLIGMCYQRGLVMKEYCSNFQPFCEKKP